MPAYVKHDVTGLKEFISAMDNLTKPPSFTATAKLESALSQVFAETQSRTHVITGSLAASGRTESDFDGQVWEGAILYGDGGYFRPVTPGPPRTSASYAVYEFARGGDHDPFEGLEVYDHVFESAIDSFLKEATS
jgi:hypothetical protein